MEPLPLDLAPLNGDAEPPDSSLPEQIQTPTQVERPSDSLRGKKSRRATGQDSQVSARVREGRTPLGMAHGRPPDPVDSQTRGLVVLERNPINPKALVCVHPTRRLVPTRVPARTSIRGPIQAPSTLIQTPILRCQCCSRGSKTLPDRVWTASRLSPPKSIHLLGPSCRRYLTPLNAFEAQRRCGARATQCREASCTLEVGWPCC